MATDSWPVSQCSAPQCQAPIVWARTEGGKNTPVDVEPSPDGRWALVADPAAHPAPLARFVNALDRAGHDGPLHTAHWGTCVKPNRYRR